MSRSNRDRKAAVWSIVGKRPHRFSTFPNVTDGGAFRPVVFSQSPFAPKRKTRTPAAPSVAATSRLCSSGYVRMGEDARR